MKSSMFDENLCQTIQEKGLQQMESGCLTEEQTMYHITKSSKLEHVLYDVRGPVVDEAARMEQEGTNVLKLNIGNPAPFGFKAPDEVIYDLRHQLTECEGYSDSKGLPTNGATTGPHLHLSIKKDGKAVNPLNYFS